MSGSAATSKTNIIGIDGALAGTKDQAGTLTWNLTNLHGDITGTTDNTGLPTAAGYESTEYGAPRNPATTPDTYGWVGAKQRSTNNLGGLTLMGVRLYNPTTGRFLTVDPVPGGNANAYTYPTDPINGYDLDGRWGWLGWVGRHIGSAAPTLTSPGAAGDRHCTGITISSELNDAGEVRTNFGTTTMTTRDATRVVRPVRDSGSF